MCARVPEELPAANGCNQVELPGHLLVTADHFQPALPTSRYELLRPLGDGGVGQVFAALDGETGERVALKELTHRSPLHVLRFKRELRALADIRHHNLVSALRRMGVHAAEREIRAYYLELVHAA